MKYRYKVLNGEGAVKGCEAIAFLSHESGTESENAVSKRVGDVRASRLGDNKEIYRVSRKKKRGTAIFKLWNSGYFKREHLQ